MLQFLSYTVEGGPYILRVVLLRRLKVFYAVGLHHKEARSALEHILGPSHHRLDLRKVLLGRVLRSRRAVVVVGILLVDTLVVWL